ncbi:MAG: GntR family transcriptional regulator [Gammaproteobacteria bacterium]|nr:GntR family transcriptional regulator [Gammaproteobacteria bacterium]
MINKLTDLSKKSLSDKVFHAIREMIETGIMPPGSKISEPNLAKKLDVSRVPIRDAILKLQSCGLVERQMNVGAKVITLSAAKLIDIYHIRERLEGLAAKFTAEKISDKDINYLLLLLENQKKPLKEKQEYYQEGGDLDIHYLIVKSCNNEQLIQLFNDSLYYLIRVYRFQFGMRGRRVNSAYQEHKAIVNAIANRDGEMAEMLMRQHIRASRKDIEEQLIKGVSSEPRKII